MEEYSTIDICKILGIHRQRLREWLSLFGGIIPSIRKAEGTGTRNVFSRWDVYAIEIYKRLLDTGISRMNARLFIDTWTEETSKMRLEDRDEIESVSLLHYFAENPTKAKYVDGTEIGILKKGDGPFDPSMISLPPDSIAFKYDIINARNIITFVDKRLG